MLEYDRQMFGKAFIEALERYFESTLHDKVRVHKIDEAISVPVFLERTYAFYKTRIVGRPFVLIAARENAAAPADIAKHVSLVRAAVDSAVIFATSSLSAHNRSRLIARGVAFAVPGNQLYIPDLAMDLRENFRASKPQGIERLSPAAQAVLFRYILGLGEIAVTPSAIAGRLRYSSMSVGRAFDDLVATGLAKTAKRGKERQIYFNMGRRELIETARPLLRSPVRSIKYIRDNRPVPNLPRGPVHINMYIHNSRPMSKLQEAGESALALLTDLMLPQTDTFAVAAKDWKKIAETLKFVEVDEFDKSFMVETWFYDPIGLSTNSFVDPLSLYAQFHDHRDERVSMAAKTLLEDTLWWLESKNSENISPGTKISM